MALEVMIPPDIVPAEESVELVDDATAVFRPLFGSGLVQRVQQATPRFRVTQKWRALRSYDRARMVAVCQQLQGKYNTLRAVIGYGPRGSAATTELVTNNDFSNGTTGWAAGGEATIAVNDRVLRVTRASNSSGTSATASPTSVAAAVQYATYAWKNYIKFIQCGTQPAPSYTTNMGVIGNDWDSYSSRAYPRLSIKAGYASAAAVPTLYCDNMNGGSVASVAGEYFEIGWTSFSQCGLYDANANSILYSDQFDNAAWTKTNLTVTADTVRDPVGLTTADTLNEGTATGAHSVSQAATKTANTEDWTGVVFAKANTCTQLRVVVGDSSNNGAVIYNISTGAVVSAAAVSGTATNARSSIVDCGNGWFKISLTVRISSGTTTTNSVTFNMCNAGSASYTGTSRTCYVWRGGYAQSSASFFPGSSTSSANSGTTRNETVFLKALPASTTGLLLPGDFITIGDELKQLTTQVDTDASGCARAGISVPIVAQSWAPTSIAEPLGNMPVIWKQPVGKFILVDNPKWSNQFGVYADLELTFEQIYEP